MMQHARRDQAERREHRFCLYRGGRDREARDGGANRADLRLRTDALDPNSRRGIFR